MRLHGALALGIFAAHGAAHVARGAAHDVLWTCNVAPLLIGVGCLLSAATPIAIGVSWLTFGTPMWLLDLATGGTVMPTSFLTHLGGLAIGVLALRKLRFPRHTWWKASIAVVALMLLSRALTPRAANVNLAFAVWTGWERVFPVYAVYFVLILSAATATFFAVERLALRYLSS